MRCTAFVLSILSGLLSCVNGVVFAADYMELPPADAQRAINVTDEQTERVRKERTLLIERLKISLPWVEEMLQIRRDELSIIVEAAGTDDPSELDLAQQALAEQCELRDLEIAKIQVQIGEIKSKLASLGDAGTSDRSKSEKKEGVARTGGLEHRMEKFLSRKMEMLSKREARLTDETDHLKVRIRKLEHRSNQIRNLQREVDSRHEDFFRIRNEIERTRLDLNSIESR